LKVSALKFVLAMSLKKKEKLNFQKEEKRKKERKKREPFNFLHTLHAFLSDILTR